MRVVLAALAVLVCVHAISIEIMLETGPETLTAGPNQTPVEAATAFLSLHGLPMEHAAQLAGALEAAYAAEAQQHAAPPAARQPIVQLPLSLDGKDHVVELYDGDDPLAVATAFIAAQPLADSSTGEMMVQQISAALTQRLQAFAAQTPPPAEPTPAPTPQQQQQQQAPDAAAAAAAAATASSDAEIEAKVATLDLPPARTIVQVEVDADLVPLEVLITDSPEQAALRFVDKYNFDASNLPALVSAVEAKIADADASNLLFMFPVTVDRARQYIAVHDGDKPTELAAGFAAQSGLEGHDLYGDFVRGIELGLVDAWNRAQTFSGLSPEQQAAEQAEAAARAQARMAEAAAPVKSVSLVVAGVAFDLEVPEGSATDPLSLGAAFCRQEWDILEPVLRQDADARGLADTPITLDLCANSMASLLSTQLA